MRVQWVCSREQRIVLYKRSSINQSIKSCLWTLSCDFVLHSCETVKWLSSLPILMQESFWWCQCSDRYIISFSPHLHTPFPHLLPVPNIVISLMVSVDVKHHVYLLSINVCNVSVPQLGPWGSPSIEWEGSMHSHFRCTCTLSLMHTCIHRTCDKSAALPATPTLGGFSGGVCVCTHTHLVRDFCFKMLHQLSGTVSLAVRSSNTLTSF